MFRSTTSWTIMLILTVSGTNVQAGPPGKLMRTFLNPVPDTGDQFGSAIAVSGRTMLVGAPRGGPNVDSDAGIAYLFDTDTGDLVQSFQHPIFAGQESNDKFGASLSFVGERALVGATDADAALNGLGAAYLFDTNTGDLLHTLVSPTPSSDDRFGSAVGISHSHLFVGDRKNNSPDNGAGEAYMFDSVTGELQKTIQNPSPNDDDFFGASMVSNGSMVLIGEINDDSGAPGLQAGVAHLYDAETGNLLHTFLNPTPAHNDVFGQAVDMNNMKVVIGDPFDDTHALNSGAVYVFDIATGDLLRTVVNPAPGINDLFGESVAFVGDDLLVGATGDDTDQGVGAAYLIDGETGAVILTLTHPTDASSTNFGGSVAAAGMNLIVAATQDNTGAATTGAVYMFKGVPEPSTLTLAVFIGFVALCTWRPRRSNA